MAYNQRRRRHHGADDDSDSSDIDTQVRRYLARSQSDRHDDYSSHQHHHRHHHHSHHSHHNQHSRNHHSGNGKSISPFANMRFLVSSLPEENCDCPPWDTVIQVYTRDSGLCPICLSHPVAGQITMCGHVFCATCALSMLEHSSTCPLCFKAVIRKELRACACDTAPKIAPEDSVTFLRIHRPKHMWDVVDEDLPQYRRMRVATTADLNAIIERECAELHNHASEAPDEQAAVERAMELVIQRPHYQAVKSERHVDDIKGAATRNKDGSNDDWVWYQHDSGAPYILDPLNVAMLRTQYGGWDLAKLPSLITNAKVTSVRWISVGSAEAEVLLHRMKFLSHFPHGCSIALVECKPFDCISPDVARQFEEQLRVREFERIEREAREHDISQKAAARLEEGLRRDIYRNADVALPTEHTSPRFTPDDFVSLPGTIDPPVALERSNSVPSDWRVIASAKDNDFPTLGEAQALDDDAALAARLQMEELELGQQEGAPVNNTAGSAGRATGSKKKKKFGKGQRLELFSD